MTESSQPSGAPRGTGTGTSTGASTGATGTTRTTGTTGSGAWHARTEATADGSHPRGHGVNSPWVLGGVTFAGVLMLMNGVFAVLEGIAAIVKDDVFASVDGYIYRINLTGWGWILLILGILAVIAGAGILAGAAWARVTGIALAALSMVVHFMFLPYQPIWSLVMIAIDFFVIWALSVYRSDAPATAGRQATV